MVQGILHRAGVAIVLIAVLLLPYGRCQSPSRAGAHECCTHHSAPAASVKSSCCTVRSELPAVPVEQAVVNPGVAIMAAEFVPAAVPAVARQSAAVVAPPRHWSPPGKSVLRI